MDKGRCHRSASVSSLAPAAAMRWAAIPDRVKAPRNVALVSLMASSFLQQAPDVLHLEASSLKKDPFLRMKVR